MMWLSIACILLSIGAIMTSITILRLITRIEKLENAQAVEINKERNP